MYPLLIFDWDGTLIDSAGTIIDCMRQAAQDCGQQPPAADAIREIIGLGLPEALAQLCPGSTPEQREALRQAYVARFLSPQTPASLLFPGVEAGLHALRARGFRLAVATGKSRRGLDRVLGESGLADLFESTRCADETRSKPHPQMLHELLKETAVGADEALLIGDTEYDLAMAAEAGMAAVGVSYGAHPPERLRNHSPLILVDDFASLCHWLESPAVPSSRKDTTLHREMPDLE